MEGGGGGSGISVEPSGGARGGKSGSASGIRASICIAVGPISQRDRHHENIAHQIAHFPQLCDQHQNTIGEGLQNDICVHIVDEFRGLRCRQHYWREW